MNSQLYLLTLLACLACNTSKKEVVIKSDSTDVVKDSAKAVVVTTEEQVVVRSGELKEEKGEFVYTIANDYSFVSSPYDFDLSATTIESMLGPEAKTSVEEFEGGEDYDAYSITTITFKDSKISFYSFAGKHFADIYTDLLPFRNGIKVGMTKQDFIKAMALEGEDALKATTYEMLDDYGSMKFSFRDDKLYNIYVSYEEGD
jgi:hypothetical protein